MTDQKKAGRILDKNFGVASFRYNRWSADLDESQTLDDALVPEFWANSADKIMGHDKANPKGRGDIIEVRKLDTGLYAELIVMEVGRGYVVTRLIRTYEPPAATTVANAPLDVRWNAGKKTHEVFRVSDKQLMSGGFQTREKAQAWIADHMKAMAA